MNNAAAITAEPTVTTENGVTTHHNVKSRDRKRFGVVYEGEARKGHHVEVKPGDYVRLFGTNKKVRYLKVHHRDGSMSGKSVPYDQDYDLTFRVGDRAEYDSYNLSYTGIIVSIGAKTIGIQSDHGKVKRLRLHEFSWRNDDFDIEKIRARNADTMMHI